jgi:nucleotide-binding universal stress UspA family protein
MFNKILIPLDGSALAERALEPALQIARQCESEIVFLRVPVADRVLMPLMGDPAAVYGAPWPNPVNDEVLARVEDYLHTLAQTYTDVRAQTKVIVGDVAQVIADTARAEKADLIVMSSHGYSGVTRWLLGSVAERVLHEAPCPVFIARSEDKPRHLLLALDGSQLAERALGPALTIAASLQLPVTLARAIPRVPAEELHRLDQLERGLGRRLEEELREEAETYLVEQGHRHQAAHADITYIVLHDPVAEGLMDYAEAHGANLIAMSTHGRTGLQRWRYGSVTDKVLHGAGHCSMLIVRPT